MVFAARSGTGTVPPIETGTADGTGKKVGLLFDITGRGDKSFNDAAAAGIDKAKADYGITGSESTPTAADGSDRPRASRRSPASRTSSWPWASCGPPR